MKTIDEFFTRAGFEFRQIKRHGNVALFSQARPGVLQPLAFEVVVIKVAPACEVFGKPIPEREVYPTSEQWGRLGFTCVEKSQANQRYDALLCVERTPRNGD